MQMDRTTSRAFLVFRVHRNDFTTGLVRRGPVFAVGDLPEGLAEPPRDPGTWSRSFGDSVHGHGALDTETEATPQLQRHVVTPDAAVDDAHGRPQQVHRLHVRDDRAPGEAQLRHLRDAAQEASVYLDQMLTQRLVVGASFAQEQLRLRHVGAQQRLGQEPQDQQRQRDNGQQLEQHRDDWTPRPGIR